MISYNMIMPSIAELLERHFEASKAVGQAWKGSPDPGYYEAVKEYLEASEAINKAQKEQEDNPLEITT